MEVQSKESKITGIQFGHCADSFLKIKIMSMIFNIILDFFIVYCTETNLVSAFRNHELRSKSDFLIPPKQNNVLKVRKVCTYYLPSWWLVIANEIKIAF